MEPIISPWLFYLANVCGSLHSCFNMILTVLLVVLICCCLTWILDRDGFMHSERLKNIVPKLSIAACIVGILLCVIPSQNTVYKMVIASTITENNIQAVQNNTIEFVRKVVEAMKKEYE